MNDNELPADLGHPHEDRRERLSFWAGIITGGALLALCIGMLCWVLLAS